MQFEHLTLFKEQRMLPIFDMVIKTELARCPISDSGLNVLKSVCRFCYNRCQREERGQRWQQATSNSQPAVACRVKAEQSPSLFAVTTGGRAYPAAA